MTNTLLLVLTAWLADFGWIATVLLVAAIAMRQVMRDPGSRVLLAWGTWTAIAVGAVLVALPVWPRWEVSRVIGRGATSAPLIAVVDQSLVAEPVIVVEAQSDEAEYRSINVAAQRSIHVGWPELLITIWAAAALLASGWVAVGFWQARRLLRTAKSAPSWIIEELKGIAGGKRAAADVQLSRRLSSAVALGAFRPRIVLPEASAERANAKEVRAALAHEWAHIRHGDLWLLALERVLVPLLALHPLFWWLRRSTRMEQELLADAAAAGDEPAEYAEALVAWAQEPASAPFGVAALAMWERPSNLSRRVHMILNHHRSLTTRLGRLFGLAAACMVLGLAGALSTLTTRPLAAKDEPVAKPIEGQDPDAAAPQSVSIAPVSVAASEPAVPNAEADDSLRSAELVITLQATFFALDRAEFPETKKHVVQVVEAAAGKKLERIGDSQPRSFNQRSGGALVGEIDQSAERRLTGEIHMIEGVKLLSRAKIIALDGQEAQVQMAEQGPRVIIKREIDGKIEEEREEVQRGTEYWLRVKPRIQTTDEGQLTLTIQAARSQLNVNQTTTGIKVKAGMGKTLVIVCSEPYAILISPMSVERQRASDRPTAAEPAPSRAPIASYQAPAYPAAGPIALPGSTPRPVTVPATTAGSNPTALPILPGVAVLPGVPGTPGFSSPHPAPLAPRPIGAAQATTPTVPAPPVRVVAQSAAPSATPLASSATGQPTLPTAHQKQRKLMELDLAAAQLEVEVAEVELAEVEEIRQKNPAAISKQELRKRQLQVDRAKIQVKRMQVQLGDDGKADAHRPTAPKPAGR